MCTVTCVRHRGPGLSPAALAALTDLYEHPVVRRLAGVFADAGAQLYVVGGPVRDALRGGVAFDDLDFTTDLRPEQTRAVLAPLGTLWDAGERFGTIAVSMRVGDLVEKVEVTTFRTEVYAADSRKPEVGFGDDIVDDLRRRDLTVNAIAMNVMDGCLVDPFGGIEALAAGLLDTPDDPVVTQSEDPLRILRAIRFAGRLEAGLAPRLLQAVATTRHRLDIVSASRRLDELRKLVALGPAATRTGLVLAGDLGVLDTWIPGASPAAAARVECCTGLDELLAALLLDSATLEETLRRMQVPGATLRRARQLRDLAAELVAGPATTAVARRVLRAADDETLAATRRVLLAGAGQVPDLWAVIAHVTATEPDVRAPLPLGGSDLVALGLKGRDVGRAIATMEAQRCAAGTLSLAEARALLAPATAG